MYLYQQKTITDFPFSELLPNIFPTYSHDFNKYKTNRFVRDAWVNPEGVVFDLSNLPFPKHYRFAELLAECGSIPTTSNLEVYLEKAGWIKISDYSLIRQKQNQSVF